MKTSCELCHMNPATHVLDYLGVVVCSACVANIDRAIVRMNALPDHASCDNCCCLERDRLCSLLRIVVPSEGRCQQWIRSSAPTTGASPSPSAPESDLPSAETEPTH